MKKKYYLNIKLIALSLSLSVSMDISANDFSNDLSEVLVNSCLNSSKNSFTVRILNSLTKRSEKSVALESCVKKTTAKFVAAQDQRWIIEEISDIEFRKKIAVPKLQEKSNTYGGVLREETKSVEITFSESNIKSKDQSADLPTLPNYRSISERNR